MYLLCAKKSKLPSHQVFGVFALEVNNILQATSPKLRREMGMCAIIVHVRIRTAVVLYEYSLYVLPVSSL